MHVRWFGQSAFYLAEGGISVVIDPFGPMEALASRGMQFAYPPIRGVTADLVLITHEHADHNAAAVVGGAPRLIRATAGTFDSPTGDVVAIASEHDDAAGTRRGPNTNLANELCSLRAACTAVRPKPCSADLPNLSGRTAPG